MNPSTRCTQSRLTAGEVELSVLDRKILNIIQEGLPLDSRPFKLMAESIGISEEELLKGIKSLREKGVIRDYSARISHRRLGFKSTLLGLRVPEDMIESMAKELSAYSEVTHCFQRQGEYNLWTVFIYKDGRLEGILKRIEKKIGRDNILNLKTIRQFKLKAGLEVK